STGSASRIGVTPAPAADAAAVAGSTVSAGWKSCPQRIQCSDPLGCVVPQEAQMIELAMIRPHKPTALDPVGAATDVMKSRLTFPSLTHSLADRSAFAPVQ